MMRCLRLSQKLNHALLALALVGLAGCDNTQNGMSNSQSGGIFGQKKQQWTIRCYQTQSPNHVELANQYAALMKQVKGLNARLVRVESTQSSSTLYYGSYTKNSNASGDQVFPEKFTNDMAIIRGVIYNQSAPFNFAVPEPIGEAGRQEASQWSIERATGPYTLQIAQFYDTPTFTGRKKTAEQYVASLRAEGYPAYIHHGDLVSIVFVGDFGPQDIVGSRQDPQLGPRVKELIARNPAEFQNSTENGFIRKLLGSSGQMEPIPSILVEIPGKGPSSSR